MAKIKKARKISNASSALKATFVLRISAKQEESAAKLTYSFSSFLK